MKTTLTTLLMFLICIRIGFAQQSEKQADIKFEQTTYDLGTFGESSCPVTCVFKFTNTGTGLLVIHQAIASCGCTIPVFPKEPIKPGESAEIKVTYNGKGRRAGSFEKTITIRANTKAEIHRLQIKGSMIADMK